VLYIGWSRYPAEYRRIWGIPCTAEGGTVEKAKTVDRQKSKLFCDTAEKVSTGRIGRVQCNDQKYRHIHFSTADKEPSYILRYRQKGTVKNRGTVYRQKSTVK